MSLINPKDLTIIQAVLNEGTFTKAADALFMSQPALSQAIKRMEDRVGQAIFDRDESPIVLTPTGSVCYRALLDMERIQERLEIELGQVEGGVRTELRIGATRSRLTYWMPLLVSEFQEIYPMVKLTFVEASALELIDQVRHSTLSFALIPELNDYADLDFQALYQEEIVLAGVDTGAYPFSHKSCIAYEELDELPIIALPQGHHVRRVQEQIFAKHQLHLNIVREAKSDITAFRFASAGEGFVLCSDIVPRYILPIYDTKIWSLGEQGHYRRIGVVNRKDRPLNALAKHFCERYQALARGQISSYGSNLN